MTASPLTLKKMRAPGRARLGLWAWLEPWAGRGAASAAAAGAALLLAASVLTGSARAAEPVKGEVKVYTDGGFARIVFRLEETVAAKVRVSGAIMVIEFDKPVAVAVDRINAGAPDYLSAARSDPDGTAIRIALARRVKVNSMPAAERLYVDLLPDSWTGVPPGLPQEVVDDLAKRAREAERQLHNQRLTDQHKKPAQVRVKVASLPTFSRYIFDLPDNANVVPDQRDGRLRLNFDRQIKWDMADAKATLPATLESIEAEIEFNSTAVMFQLNGTPEVRTFREDRSIVVDIGHDGAEPKLAVDEGGLVQQSAATAAPGIEPPETVPAKDAPQQTVKHDPAAKVTPVPAPSDVVAPAYRAAMAPPKAPNASSLESPSQNPPSLDPPSAKMPEAPLAAKPAAMPSPPAADRMPAAETVPKMDAKSDGKSDAKKELSPDTKADTHRAIAPAAMAPEPAHDMASAPKHDMAPAADAAPNDAAKSAAAPAQPAQPAPNPNAPVKAAVNHSGGNLRVEFPFAVPTPAAVFRRADTLWLVFDSAAKVDLSAFAAVSSKQIRGAESTRGQDGEAIVRIRLARPQLASLSADGSTWIVNIGDTVTVPSRPLVIARSVAGKNMASLAIPFDGASKVHRLSDPDIGDQLMAITALGPARGFIKAQYFVELRALPSTHGVVVQPIADDIAAELSADKIMISRPGGLSLSSTAIANQQQVAVNFRALTFDTQLWGFDRNAPFIARQAELIRIAAATPATKRRQARFNLARFYLARDLAAEAKAVLDVALGDQRGAEDVTGSILTAIANVKLGRPEEALKDLANPQIGNQQDAPIWRAIAYARQGRWPEAHDAFKIAGDAIGALPIELQRMAMQEAMRTAIEVHDFTDASRIANEFETMGVPAGLEPTVAVLSGRLYQGLGRTEDALTSYRSGAASHDRRAAAQGRLRELVLLFAAGTMPRNEMIHELETLTTVWRGDETETEGLKLLAHLYTQDNRYRDAFHVMRTALLAHPNSDMTRKIQDEAAATFDSLFLAGKGDAMPPIAALGLFYDFRELTPIGRRGDEMIRRLADRLVAVDLLDQAAELLQHQVEHRLQGAARAQVAARLATIYLMNRKPDFALATLRKTRSSDLSNELRDQRLLIEARAMSDGGRHDLALEVIANIKGPEAIRLRANILWAAKRWRDAGEQIEKLYGERWRDFKPLNDNERDDILRAAIGYALGDESLGLLRLREKYAAKMADGPDRRAFDVVTAPIAVTGPEFQNVAKKVAATDTLDAFLRDLHARFPDAAAADGNKDDTAAKAPERLPDIAAKAGAPDKAAANAPPKPGAAPLPPTVPAGVPLKPDQSPTGSIGRRLPKAQ